MRAKADARTLTANFIADICHHPQRLDAAAARPSHDLEAQSRVRRSTLGRTRS
jgi:hypothetical protein